MLTLSLLSILGCFPKQPGPRLLHFEQLAPALGEPAPRFRAVDLEGHEIDLGEQIGELPIVLQFGSHTCPVYRYRRHSMKRLWSEYEGRVLFLLIYVQEAHPMNSKSPYTDQEWDIWWNRLTGVRITQPQDAAERRTLAKFSHHKLQLVPPMVVDTIDNDLWSRYGQGSSPAFVIDTEGLIVARQPWVDPKGLKVVLDSLLETQPD